MDRNHQIAVEILEEIDRARSSAMALEQLEERLWRLLDETGPGFPPRVAGQVEDLVLELRRLRRENLAFASGAEADEFRGSEQIFNEVIGALSRYLG